MGAIELAGAFADPQHVSGAVVPVARDAVLPSERLLVPEKERLVARVEVDLPHRRIVGVEPASAHEAKSPVDAVGQRLVAPSDRARRDELLVPVVYLAQVGETATGEGPQQVQRRRTGVVRLEETARIGRPRRFIEAGVVDDVSTEARQRLVTAGLGAARPRLGVLARDPADLHDGQARRVLQDHRHLQDDLQLVANRVGRTQIERLRAVAGLEHKGFPGRDPSQLIGEAAGLAGEDQRRPGSELVEGLVDRAEFGPLGLLPRGAVSPGTGMPGGCHPSGLTARTWVNQGGYVSRRQVSSRCCCVATPRCCCVATPRWPARPRGVRPRHA